MRARHPAWFEEEFTFWCVRYLEMVRPPSTVARNTFGSNEAFPTFLGIADAPNLAMASGINRTTTAQPSVVEPDEPVTISEVLAGASGCSYIHGTSARPDGSSDKMLHYFAACAEGVGGEAQPVFHVTDSGSADASAMYRFVGLRLIKF